MNEGEVIFMILKNDYIQCTLDKKGAELISLYNIETGQEIMWHGDDAWWSGISPILFPFIGTSKDHKYNYDGKSYDMKPHGFLAQRDFMIESVTEDAVWFSYTSNDEDYDLYPFRFRIKVGYKISWSKVEVKWLVENLDDKAMYYTIGAHPAFLCDEGDVLSFERKNDETHFYHLDGPLILNKEKQIPERIVMGDDAFPVDTFIYDNVRSISLLNLNKGSSVKVTFDDFDYVGVWSPVKNGKMGPFVCIEPWQGLPDFTDASGLLEDKKTVTKLDKKSEIAYKYSIEIA